MTRIPVQGRTDEVYEEGLVNGEQGMLDLLDEAIHVSMRQARAMGLTRKELLAEEVTETDGHGRPIGIKPKYELRYVGRFRYVHDSILGKTYTHNFRTLVTKHIAGWLRDLKEVQPNCQWEIVAALLKFPPRAYGADALAMPVEVEQAIPHGAVDLEKWASIKHSSLPTQQEERNREVRRASRMVVLELVAANVNHGPLRDPWADLNKLNPGAPGDLARYLQTNEIRHLPLPLRRERAHAERVINDYYAYLELLGVPQEEEPAVFVEDLVREEMEAIAKGSAEERLERAYASWQATGGYKEAGDILGVHYQKAKAMLERWSVGNPEAAARMAERS